LDHDELKTIGTLVLAILCVPASAADYPTPREGEWVAREFKFHTGEVLAELKLHYTTVGSPTGIPIVELHGTGLSAKSKLTADFAGELFGQGQPLDATKYFIVIPDRDLGIGT
jgi:homoserine O-acetyltransferase/O-succinyltransferase